MKYYCFMLMTTVLFLISCSKKEGKGNLHISGTIKGLKKGTLYIQKIKDTALVIIDSIQFNGNEDFTSDLEIKSPEMYYLALDRGVTSSLDNNLPFFAEAGAIKIETSLAYFLSDAKISGSKNQTKYEEFKKITSKFNDQNLSLMELKFNALKNKNLKMADSITTLQDAITRRRYLYTTNFALTNNDFEVAPFVTLSEISNINIKFLDTIQKSMSPKVAKSLYGKKLIQLFQERKKLEE